MSDQEILYSGRKIRKLYRKAIGIYGRGRGLRSPASIAERSVRETSTSNQHSLDSTTQNSLTFNMADEMLGMNCKLEGKFPDLVLLDRNNGKVEKGLLMLKRNFSLSLYGAIGTSAGYRKNVNQFKIIWQGETLVTAEGQERSEAEYNACFTLIKELRKTNYFIEFKKEYWPGYKKWPAFILNPDLSMRHIYRVVCLKNASLSHFPFPLSGAIDYVFSEEELWQYVEDHGFSKSNSDLFILNIEKPKHKIIKQICCKTDMVAKQLIGCSNLGIHTSRKEDPYQIKQELLASGGENIKYRLLPPGTEVKGMTLDDMASDGEGQNEGPAKKQAKLEEIEISQWIADHLILMDILDERSYSETAKEIIFCCVRDCPELEEFIIEKKYDEIGLVKAEALIDRKLVGRAQAFKTYDVKKFAAENALENLRKVCKYIEIKQSYSGIGSADTEFFIDKAPGYKDDVCWIANRYELSNTDYEEKLNKLLRMFKNASVEDLFFIKDFEEEERMQIYELARKMGFSVRKFGMQYVCVYKKRRPKDVYKELMLKEVTENNKYRLIHPKPKNEIETYSEIEAEMKYQNLFDTMNEEEEETEENYDKKWKDSRGNNKNQGRNNKNSVKNNRGQKEGGQRNSRNNCRGSRQESRRSQDQSWDHASSRYGNSSGCYETSANCYESSASGYGSGTSRYTTGGNGYETGTSRFETGDSRYETGTNRYETGASRYETGASRFEIGASRYETGANRYETGAYRYETGASRYEDRSDSRYDSHASRSNSGTDFYANSNVRVYDYQGQSRSSQQSSDNLFTRRSRDSTYQR